MNLLQRAVANLAEIFAPIIPAIIVGGLILGFEISSEILNFWKTEQNRLRKCISSGRELMISYG